MRKLLLQFLLIILPLAASAEEVVVNGIKYYINQADKTAQVIHKIDYEGAVVIPSSISYGGNTYSVTSIQNDAFRTCHGLTSIEIPNSITSIGNYAFENCSSLTSISIPNSVTSIGYYTFSGCIGLTTVEVLCSPTNIGYSVFSNCPIKEVTFNCEIVKPLFNGFSTLENVTLKECVTSIEDNAFHSCRGLTSVSIPNSVTSIGNYAFEDCSSLTSVEILCNPTKIGYSVFDNCPIKEVTFNCETVTPLFKGCSTLENITLKEKVTSIDDYAFSECRGLTSISIPSSVKSIGGYAFYNCSDLISVEVLCSPTSIGSSVFLSSPVKDVVFDCETVTSLFRSISTLENVTIKESVTSIDDYAFYSCKGLTSVSIPNSVTSIGDYAFEYCSSLTSVELLCNPTRIGYSVFDNCPIKEVIFNCETVTPLFKGCSTLENITLKEKVTSIDDYAFFECGCLTSMSISNSVTSIGNFAFWGCNSLKSVHISDLAAWCNILFSDSDSNPLYYAHHLIMNGEEIVDLAIPHSVTAINDYAFEGCNSFTSVTIPNSTTSIGSHAFDGCIGLNSVTIPKSVTAIGDDAFANCNAITSINIPGTIQRFLFNREILSEVYISSNPSNLADVIEGCTGPITVTLLEGVNTIEKWAFKDAECITSVKFPSSLTTIENYAFSGCKGLTSITIPENVTSIGAGAFAFCENLASITIQCSPTDRFMDYYESVFNNCDNISEVTFDCKTITPIFSGKTLDLVKEVTLTNKVLSIEENAFEPFYSLTSITIPQSVTTIADWALRCPALTSATILCSPTTVGGYVFGYESVLDEVIFDCEKVTPLVNWNTSIKKVTLTEKVTSVDDGAFNGCSSLKDLYCFATTIPETNDPWLFEGVPLETATLHVPKGCKEKYAAVSPWSSFVNIVEIFEDPTLFPDCNNEEIRYAAIYLHEKGIVEGEDGKLYADREATRAEVAKTSLYGVYFGPSNVPEVLAVDDYPSVYTDLQDKNTYYYRPAKALLYLEYGDGVAPFDRNRLLFEPEGKIARVNVLKELLETFNIKPDVEGTDNPFPYDEDVMALANSNPVKMGYIRKAAALGIITTDNDEFRPFANCTRGEEFLMLARIMQKIEDGEIDNPSPEEADYFQPLNTTLQTISLGASLQMGNFQHYTKTSFALTGTVPMAFMHTYNSYNTTLPSVFYGAKTVNNVEETYQPLGDGWSHNYHSFITVVGEYGSGTPANDLRAIVHWGGGSIDVYKSDGSRLIPESMGIYSNLELDGQDAVITSKSQMTYRFTKQGSTGAGVLYLSSIKDRNGNTLTINYENGQNGSKRISSVSDGHRSLTFSYLNGTDLLSEVKDPLNRSIKFVYFDNQQTGKKQLQSFTDAEGNTTTYEYADLSKAGTSKLLSRIQLPKGNYIENEYDANCRLKNTASGINDTPATMTSVSVAANYGSNISTQSQIDVQRGSETSSYHYTFNENNVVTEMTGAMGLYMSNSYGSTDHPELPTSMQNNRSNVSNISYDAKGNVTSITVTGEGTLTTTMTYDDMNNLTSVTDPMDNVTTYSYDEKGNLKGISAPESVTTAITVDSKGLPTETTNPMGVKTQYQYNEYGNLTKTTLPALELSSTAVYDDASRMTSMTDAMGRTYSFVYNNNDFLTRETDPMNHSTSYAYDKNNNLTSITNAKGGVTTMTYDNAKDWLLTVEFAGAKKQYSYNEDGTVSYYTKPDGRSLGYYYDELGRVIRYENYEYSYDNKNRLSEVSYAGEPMSFTYDGFNRITGVDYNHKHISYSYDKNGNRTSVNNTQYSYDGLNRLTEVSFSGKSITYTYRKDSQLSKVEYPNGMTTTYGYDNVGRLTSKETKLDNGTVVAGYTYTLNKVGNIIEQTTQEPYNDMVLASEETSYSYNDGNRITKAGDISFEFDANGNTKKRGNTTYVWDCHNKLIDADNSGFIYDPLGFLATYQGDIKFTTDPMGIGNVLSDSKSGAEYIYGNGLEARVINGQASYYVTDVRGSVVAIVDDDGNITHKYQYNAFGKVTQKEEANFNPFQYVGKWGVMYMNDHLYYMRARYYDPTIGRFLSEDPIWSTNLYPYAENNPIMGIDPRGEARIKYRAIDGYPEFLTNVNVRHVQIFFDNPVTIEGENGGRPIYDIGYGADFGGSPMYNDGDPLYEHKYYDTEEYYPDEVMLEAVKNFRPSEMGKYDLVTTNCQDYVNIIRGIVKLILKRNAILEAKNKDWNGNNQKSNRTPATIGPTDF